MALPHFLLADGQRSLQFLLLGAQRFRRSEVQTWTDETGKAWAGLRADGHWLGACAVGPNWVFDDYAQRRRAVDYERLRQDYADLDEQQRLRRAAGSLDDLRVGSICEHVAWLVHARVLQAKRSVVRLPDDVVSDCIWGRDRSRRPAHWRSEVMTAFDTLSKLHVSVDTDDGIPEFGAGTALITHASDLCRSRNDGCDDDCPAAGSSRHRHFHVNIGRGFLGILESCCVQEVDGIRYYEFPARGAETTGQTLQRLGKTGNLVSVYLPARLGDPIACRQLSFRQHRLLQAIVRERTRMARRNRRHYSEAEILVGNNVPDATAKRKVACPLLDQAGRYVTFGGGRTRKGCGYLLTSESGWLARAGYERGDVADFLDDVAALAERLRLRVVGLRQRQRRVEWLSLPELQAIARSRSGVGLLERVHLRFYATEDYEVTWSAVFGWDACITPAARDVAVGHGLAELAAALRQSNTTRKSLAAGIGVDASLIGKILSGKRRCPPGFVDRAFRWIAESAAATECRTPALPSSRTAAPARPS